MGFLSFLIRLNGDNTGFKNMLGETTKVTDAWGKKLEKGFTGMLEAYAGMRLIKKELSAINEEVEKAKSIKFGSERLSTTWEQFQRIQVEADKANSSIEDVTKAVEHLGEAQAEILTKSNAGGQGMGSEKGRYAQILGLREGDLTKDPLENFLKMRSQFAGKTMTGEQRTAMKKLYGKAGGNLISMFERRDSASDFFGQRDDNEVAGALVAGQNLGAIKNFYRTVARRTFITSSMGGGEESPSVLFKYLNAASNVARHLTGTPVEELKSSEERITDAKKKNLEYAEKEKGQFYETLRMLREEADEEERRKNAKQEALELEKEQRKNVELRVALSKSDMSSREKLESDLSGARVRMRRWAGDKQNEGLYTQAENDMLTAKAALRAIDNRAGFVAAPGDSLTKVGGFIGTRQDPLIDVNKQQLEQLRRIGDQVQELNRRTGRFRDMDPANIPDAAYNV